jgi:hypothetical protein
VTPLLGHEGDHDEEPEEFVENPRKRGKSPGEGMVRGRVTD